MPSLLKVDNTSLTLRWLTPVYMAMSSRDIAALRRIIIHWISSGIGFPILADRPGGGTVDVQRSTLGYDSGMRGARRHVPPSLYLHNAGGTTLALLHETTENAGHLGPRCRSLLLSSLRHRPLSSYSRLAHRLALQIIAPARTGAGSFTSKEISISYAP